MKIDVHACSPSVLIQDDGFHFMSYTNLDTVPGRHVGEVIYTGGSLYVWDGVCWTEISSGISVGLDSNAETAIDWATKKMQEEKDLDEMCKEFPALAKARDQFEMVKALVENSYNKE